MEKVRKLDYIITSEYSGAKISDFLKSIGISSKSMIKLKSQEENVCLNGVPGYINRILKENDKLTIYIREAVSSKKIPPVNLPFSIVYEDEDILVVNKPANMPIHPSLNNYENTLGNAIAYYFSQKNEPFIFRCINRLDRDTTGLTILAKHYLSCAILYDEMAQRKIDRTYYAIVESNNKLASANPFHLPLFASGTIDYPIGRKPGSTIERMIDLTNGEKAITHYQVLATNNDLSFLELHLDTGRTHQIRVHMTETGHPLIGDFLYNPNDTRMSRQALHAGKLSFLHPITRKQLSFCAPLPDDMHSIFQIDIS